MLHTLLEQTLGPQHQLGECKACRASHVGLLACIGLLPFFSVTLC
jgi:hypothetical protein